MTPDPRIEAVTEALIHTKVPFPLGEEGDEIDLSGMFPWATLEVIGTTAVAALDAYDRDHPRVVAS